MSIFRKRPAPQAWAPETALDPRGPLACAVLDLPAAAADAAQNTHQAAALLALPNRSPREAVLRGTLFYFWCAGAAEPAACAVNGAVDGAEVPLAPWEAALNSLDTDALSDVILGVAAYVRRMRAAALDFVVPRLEHLERISFHARRLRAIAHAVHPAPPGAAAVDTVSAWLPRAGAFCQSDTAQARSRDVLVRLAVSPYDMERTESPQAFSCLVTVANERVNHIMDVASDPIQAVVRAGHDANPDFYNIAAVGVFCEYVRCKRAINAPALTLHDAGAADDVPDAAILVEAHNRLYVRAPREIYGKAVWEGPYDRAGALLTRWEVLHGATAVPDHIEEV
jgi:hypothetical protein